MQDSKFSCLVFVRVEKQRFGDANFSGREMILIVNFLLLDHRVIRNTHDMKSARLTFRSFT